MFPKALLLNASYEPLRAISWRRAIILIATEKVEVVDRYEVVVHSPSWSVKLPSILRLHAFVKTNYRHEVRFSRDNVFARDRFICQYDGRKHPKDQLTLDHVVPRRHGGRTSWENVVTCCIPCNRRKGARTPAQIGFRLLRRPARPSWRFSIRQSLGVVRMPLSWRQYVYGDPEDVEEELSLAVK